MAVLLAAASAVALACGALDPGAASRSIPIGSSESLRVAEALRLAAPDSSRADSLPLTVLLEDVAARNPMIRAAEAASRAARARIGPVTRLPDPQLQFATMNRDLPGFGLNEPLGMNQVQLMQMVPIAGKIGLASAAARAQASAASIRVAEVGWEQRVRAARLFYDLYRTDHALAVLRETRELLRQLAGVAEAMYRVGEGRQADVLRARVEIARMEEEIVRMESMRTSQAAQLNALRDRPATEPVPPPTLPSSLDVTLPSADSLVALGLTARPALQAGAQDIVAATALERRAGREIWPDLQLGMIYGQRGMTEGTERMLSLMVGASVPIWAGRRQKQMRVEAGAMREMAEADLTGIQAETRGRVTELDAEIGRARRLLALYRTTVIPQASATVASATAAYRVGSVDFMTVLDNQMTVNRYRLELLVLEGELGTALAELEMYTGQGWVVPAIALPRI